MKRCQSLSLLALILLLALLIAGRILGSGPDWLIRLTGAGLLLALFAFVYSTIRVRMK